jgi:hypothetical protein
MTLENDNPNPTGAVHQAGTRHGVDEGPVAAQAVLLHILLQRIGVLRGDVGLCGEVGCAAVPPVLMKELGSLALQQDGVEACVQLICSAHSHKAWLSAIKSEGFGGHLCSTHALSCRIAASDPLNKRTSIRKKQEAAHNILGWRASAGGRELRLLPASAPSGHWQGSGNKRSPAPRCISWDLDESHVIVHQAELTSLSRPRFWLGGGPSVRRHAGSSAC